MVPLVGPSHWGLGVLELAVPCLAIFGFFALVGLAVGAAATSLGGSLPRGLGTPIGVGLGVGLPIVTAAHWLQADLRLTVLVLALVSTAVVVTSVGRRRVRASRQPQGSPPPAADRDWSRLGRLGCPHGESRRPAANAPIRGDVMDPWLARRPQLFRVRTDLAVGRRNRCGVRLQAPRLLRRVPVGAGVLSRSPWSHRSTPSPTLSPACPPTGCSPP